MNGDSVSRQRSFRMRKVSASNIRRTASRALRHYVAIAFHIQRAPNKGDAANRVETHVFSGFMMHANGIWILVTAGHIWGKIDEARETGDRFFGFRICDGWHPEAPHPKHPIPFDALSTKKVHIDYEGLDYSFVPLRKNVADLLHANRIIPIGEGHYEKNWPTRFDSFAMIGTPQSTVDPIEVNGHFRQLKLATCVLRLAEENNPPSELMKENRRFYARIKDHPNSHVWRRILGNIDGMSGGPIIGIREHPEGLKYWVVAVQSAWSKDRRVIAACPFQEFARMVAQRIRQVAGTATRGL